MSTLADQMVHPAIRMDDFMDMPGDATSDMVDPHLDMPFFDLGVKESEQLPVDPAAWSNSLDPNPFAESPAASVTSPVAQQMSNDSTGTEDCAHQVNIIEPSSPSRHTARTARIEGKTSRTLSKSSIPSLSSGPSSPGAKPARATRSTAKKQEPKAANKAAKMSPTPARNGRSKAKRDRQPSEDDNGEEGGGDVKRTKYLERNRIAASKCRQKKKAWVGDLETQKTELEAMHANLQNDYASLLEQITELKTELMNHANCGDATIDGWIAGEAKRFVVKRATDESEDDGISHFPPLTADDFFNQDQTQAGT